MVIVAVAAPIIGDDYTTSWTCWGDLEKSLVWGLILPMCIICATAIVLVEAAGMMNRKNDAFVDADKQQRASAM